MAVVLDNREIVELYLKAHEAHDLVAARELQHPEMVGRYPQSGEVFRGRDNYMAMQAAYPGLPKAQNSTVTAESNLVVLPSFIPFGHPTVTVFGGDKFVIEETIYFAAPFDAPEWRHQYSD